jgi:hypothetical protein
MHEHSELDLSDIASSLQVVAIFQTMRTNLAMIMSFVRRSLPKDPNLEQYDIGLLNVPPGEAQSATHARAVTCFLAALLSQCLDNYQKMKTVRPDLEDAGLEAFLDGLEDRCRFLSGLTRVRNAVFHVNDLKAWRHPDVGFLARGCARHGTFPEVLETLLHHLYVFTSKCFRGEWQIPPRFVYQRAAELRIPELNAKLEAGDIAVREYERAFEKLVAEPMAPGDSDHDGE